jgi:hypothetical protein
MKQTTINKNKKRNDRKMAKVERKIKNLTTNDPDKEHREKMNLMFKGRKNLRKLTPPELKFKNRLREILNTKLASLKPKQLRPAKAKADVKTF